MKKNGLITAASGSLAKTKFKLKKNSPGILIFAGVVGVISAGVMACMATRKLDDICEEGNSKVEEIKKKIEEENISEEEGKKEITKARINTGIKVIKLYSGPVIVGTLSLTAIVSSHNILKERNTALAAGYALIDKGFKEYRERVVDKFGKEVDTQLRYGIHQEEYEETVVDEKGKEKKNKQIINVADTNVHSDYVKYFTKSNPYWEKDPQYIEMFFKSQQNFLNDKLRVKGFLTLNEAYVALGFKETKAGMVCGWVYDKKNPNGDNYVEFDIKEVCIMNENGYYEGAYAIDFNVDGNIYDVML